MQNHKRPIKRWTTCLMCHQLVFATYGVGDHVCPEEARAKKDAELDMVIDAELSTWSHDLRRFWNSTDVRFTQHLLDTEQYE